MKPTASYSLGRSGDWGSDDWRGEQGAGGTTLGIRTEQPNERVFWWLLMDQRKNIIRNGFGRDDVCKRGAGAVIWFCLLILILTLILHSSYCPRSVCTC